MGLPEKITVRFVRVVLDTGEIEILVTSLLDEQAYPTEEFKELYHLRWGVETFYGLVKTRLALENFTGKTVESIKQDFYATIFITGLESILTYDLNQELEVQPEENKHKQKVNKAVSFNAIKNKVVDLFYSNMDTHEILMKLSHMFKQNRTCVREGRTVPRRKRSARALLNFHRRAKKACF